ncbi:MAG: CDP-alcohol phosphatidyltransferase family protein [Solirubrobacteraceae bacterium]
MTARVLDFGQRRPYAMPAALAAACLIAMFLTANAEGLAIVDPDGVGGPPLVRLSAILAVFIGLDVLPRAVWRANGNPLRMPARMAEVTRERWTGRRVGLVLVGLFSFYITYVAYRNFKGFLPFLRPGINDTGLLELDRVLFLGHDPATLLHGLLGTGVANSILSVAYVAYLAFVPISLAAALVWVGDIRNGLWYAMALCLNWVLGAVSYYLIPSMGPAFVAPELFADLAPSASSSLQHSLWAERLNVLYGSAPGPAKDVLQSIAAFASLHVSVVLTAAVIAQLLRANRWLLYGLWTYFAMIVVATIYLGWHYVIDDVAGAVIALLAVGIGAAATGSSLRPVAKGDGVHAERGRLSLSASAFGGRLNVPNVLSAGRIALAPVMAAIVIAHPDGSVLAATLFTVIALTDILDGHLARTRDLVTPLGKLLDPVADKALIIAALVSLVLVDRLAILVVVVIAARELLVTALRAHAARRGHVLSSSASGKAKMFLQVAMVLVLMTVADPFAAWVDVLVGATVALTVLSGLACVRACLKAGAAVRTP